MGAYLFENKFPFKPVAITDKPIIAGENISDHIPRLSNLIFVVFPGGVEEKENDYRVFFGYNDYQCRYVDVNKELLTTMLKPIVYKEEVAA